MKHKADQEHHSEQACKLPGILTKLMKQAHLDNAQLSYHTGVPITTISRLRNATDSNPTIATLIPIANFFGISVHQLIGETELSEEECSMARLHHLQTVQIPIITLQQAIDPIILNEETVQHYRWISSSAALGAGAFAIVSEGSQAIPHLPSGAAIIFSRSIQPKDMDYVVVQIKKDKPPVLRQFLVEGFDCYLKSLIDSEVIKLGKQSKIVGVMVQALMDYRKLDEEK